MGRPPYRSDSEEDSGGAGSGRGKIFSEIRYYFLTSQFRTLYVLLPTPEVRPLRPGGARSAASPPPCRHFDRAHPLVISAEALFLTVISTEAQRAEKPGRRRRPAGRRSLRRRRNTHQIPPLRPGRGRGSGRNDEPGFQPRCPAGRPLPTAWSRIWKHFLRELFLRPPRIAGFQRFCGVRAFRGVQSAKKSG